MKKVLMFLVLVALMFAINSNYKTDLVNNDVEVLGFEDDDLPDLVFLGFEDDDLPDLVFLGFEDDDLPDLVFL